MATRTRSPKSLWKRPLGESGGTPKYARIVERIRDAVDDGLLNPGDRVPSVAELAGNLGVNKTTVVRAFRELEAAGLLVSKVGKGSFVASPDDTDEPDRSPSPPAADADSVRRSVRRLRSSFAEGLHQILRVPLAKGTIRMGSGVPSPDSVDPETVRAAATAALDESFETLFGYAQNGLDPLREEIASWLNRRGYTVRAESIVITNGSQEALSIVANWSRERDRAVLCESPSYIGIQLAFSHFGHVVETVPRDGRTSLVKRLRELTRDRATTFYCCADFHNPTGTCMSEEQRREVAAVAAAEDTIVVVDDLYRDLRFEGEEPDSLYNYLPPNRRILVGSFSKSFIPGLRIGYLVADPEILTPLAEMKRTFDLGSPTLSQATAARLLRDHYEKHLANINPRYRARRDAIVAAMEEHFPDGVTFTRPEGGFQLWVTMPPGHSAVTVYLRALSVGVQISPGPAHDIDGRYPNGFRIGYSEVTRDEIERGIPRLASVLREVIEQGPDEPTATGIGLPL